MKKKLILSLVAVAALAIGVVGFSAFEAHIINVTAHIENALTVPVEAEGLSFGTVFPEEVAYKTFDMRLSDSFMSEGRVDDVEYVLRQKPKCGVPTLTNGTNGNGTHTVQYSEYVPVTEDEKGNFICPMVDIGTPEAPQQVQSVMLPLLCPYLSKTELDKAGATTTNAIPAFHGPLTNWTMEDTLATQLRGRLSKADEKTSTSWLLDLHAPCFKGQCAQDNVIPPDYQYDPAYEGQLFGCDLWIEVTNISLSNEKPKLTVIKHVDNTGGGTAVAGDFTMNVTAINPSDASFPGAESPGTDVTLDAGAYSVDETGPGGYTKSLGADCSGIIANGEHKTCTITNTFIVVPKGTLTINKVIDNKGGIGTKSATDFSFTVNAGGSTAFEADGSNSMLVEPGIYDVVEDAEAGYTTTYSNSLNANANCDDLNVPSSGSVTCTITNTVVSGTITVNKTVTNDDGGLLALGNFTLRIDGSAVTSGSPKNVAVGAHNVDEDGVFGYTAVFSGDCDSSGNLTVAAGESKTCNINNNDVRPSIQLIKTVIGGTAAPDDFDLSIDGAIKTSGSSNPVLANTPHTIDEEVIVSGYSFTSITGSSFLGVSCPAALNGTITLLPGDIVTCTITNTHP